MSDSLPVQRRDLKFPIEPQQLRDWHPDGVHVSHFLNTLSIFFPEGETFFIDSVRHYADQVKSPKLRKDIEGFLGQESFHSREHRRYNRALAASGLPVQEIEAQTLALLEFSRKTLSHRQQLGVTIALEHFTAVMADLILEDDRFLGDADPAMAALWRWHAVEETEHKAVAYDVYQEACGEQGGAYVDRALTMVLGTALFWGMTFTAHAKMVAAEGEQWNLTGWLNYGKHLLVSPGLLPRLVSPWLDYFSPTFHPWQHDNKNLVEEWKVSAAAG